MLALIALQICPINFCPCILCLPEGADVKVVIKDTLYSNYTPYRLGLYIRCLSFGLFTQLLRHARGWDSGVCKIVGDFLIAPAVVVIEVKYPAYDFCLSRHYFELPMLINDITIRCGAYPVAFCLSPFNDIFNLFRGFGDGHFIYEKMQLDFDPIVTRRKIDPVTDRDDANSGIAQILELDETAPVAPGEARKILNYKNIVHVGHQAFAHSLIAFTLLKGVARFVSVFEEG